MAITDTDRDLILRAKEATDIGVSLGQFARANGTTYRDMALLLKRAKVRIEKRSRLVLPDSLQAA